MRLSPLAAAAILTLGVAIVHPPAIGLDSPAHAAAAQATRSFAIENMTCALCPVTVRKAMEAVPGVQQVMVDFDRKTALVRYDPARTDAEAIATAATRAGYPAHAMPIRVTR